MAKTLNLTVRTPEASVVEQEVNSLKLVTDGGVIEIYPNHASLTGSITFSKLNIRTEKEDIEYLVQRGIIL